jgi:hypothetical protein
VARVVVGVAIFLVAVRFLGSLIAPGSPSFFLGLVDWLSAPLVAPFRGSFVDTGSSTHIVERSSLVALVVVALVGWGVVVLIRHLPVRRPVMTVIQTGRRARVLRSAPVVVKAMLGVVLVVISVRAMLLGAGALPQSAFVDVVYRVSSPLVAPFQSIFSDGGNATNVIEFAALLAVFVYALLGVALAQLFRVLATPAGTRPVTVRQARSGFDRTMATLAVLVYVTALVIVAQRYSPVSVPVSSDVSASNAGDSSSSGGTSGDTTTGSSNGASTGTGTAVTAIAAPTPRAAYCVVSLIYSQNGVSFYHRVNATTSAPCWSHWTVSTSSGQTCGMNYNGTWYSPPPNLWNITQWGEDRYFLYVSFQSGRSVILGCITNLGNYAQTVPYRTDWS